MVKLLTSGSPFEIVDSGSQQGLTLPLLKLKSYILLP